MTVKLLSEHDLEFLTLTGSCTGVSESTHVKMPHCWESHVKAHLNFKSIPDTSSQLVNSTINSTDTDMERVMLNVKSVGSVLYKKSKPKNCEVTIEELTHSNKQL